MTIPYRKALMQPIHDWYKWALRFHRENRLHEAPIARRFETAALRIGDVGIYGMPCEPLMGIGRQIKRLAPLPRTLPCGYMNDSCPAYVPSRTWFGDHVFVGPGVVFLNDRAPGRADPSPPVRGAFVEDEVMIGGGCVILPGVRIGRRSFIAAGATVTKNVPPGSLVVGTPGRIRPLPDSLDRDADRKLTLQPLDLWHPDSPDLSALQWPEEWPKERPR